ncbi:serine/threonine-protein kinase [Catenuloplanes atrovinosus]|uniref:non-specific serine/threonine protein kinase n=1 Tax=Catenuloplanes atrovinosus TaxID=137266 RepID=A0AAE3YNL1_9ACTN|nr:serine/threonine-protein kinase [Catenuloplanes atrovinosus]MDR7277114.1 serine/threonine-protein kinase [Catenuloplanes atrovinosus]
MWDGRQVGGRYLLREPLGDGGMSVVWRAEDTVLGREVAVKVLSADVSADPEALGRMYAEARAAASLRHDNVVEVYDYGETEIDGVPMPYVVMELVGGRPLSALLRAGALSWQVAVVIGAQVAAALAAAHDRGVVHRDVKPANVMVHSGGVKLVDFGISAAVGELEADSGQILGTPAYLAPERLAGGMVRPATDVYALGLLLYLMLAGRMPWNASTTTQMLKAHRYREPAPLPEIAGLPDEVVDLVRHCLDKAPAQRPAAIAAVRVLRRAAGLPPSTLITGLPPSTLRTGLEEREATAPVTGPPTVRARKIPHLPVRHRIAVGGALLAAAATTAVIYWPGGPRPEPAAAAPALTCRVTYTTQITSAGEAETAVTVANTGSGAVDGWTLSFRLPGEQKLLRGSDVTWRQTGDLVEASGAALAPGAATSASFDASYRTTVMLPASFTVNDVVCGAEMSVQAPPTSAPSSAPPAATGTEPQAPAPAPAAEPGPAAVPEPAAKPEPAGKKPTDKKPGKPAGKKPA